jgi:hypothetical protein
MWGKKQVKYKAANFHQTHSSLMAPLAVMLFQTGETHSNLDLTMVKYNNNKLWIVEKKSQHTYKSQNFEWLGTYLTNNVVKKMV